METIKEEVPGGPLRERLVDAGVELLAAEGPGALGLREIARRAGVSHGAPRRYFPTHRSLLSAIARRGFEDLSARFVVALAGKSEPRAQVRALGRAYVGYALERRGMFELMFRHDLLDGTGRDPAEAGPRLRESTRPLFELLTALVGRCGAAAPGVTAAALWANLHGVAQLWAWGSLSLALGEGEGRVDVDRLVAAALDAHLGSVPA
ncbi:TetR/AcrR family transcriptional regulator [Streptomyces polychromogenes]|uniref:TetR/AcrR family transcriptional regulator n=1 Tax=Streptomyces polychromogenes TaxID=67342 RepID=A0ABN0VWN0_9ACTN